MAKTFSPGAIQPGEQSLLTIQVLNLTNPATSVANLNVLDNLPAPLEIGGAISTTCSGGTLTGAVGTASIRLTGATLPAAGCTITVPVNWPKSSAGIAACGTGTSVTNTITPGAGFSTGQGQVNTPATATLGCTAVPYIDVTKTTTAKDITAGSSVTYTVTVENKGNVLATGVSVTDMVPSSAFNNITWHCTASGGAICPAASGRGNIVETGLSLPAKSGLTYLVNGTVVDHPPATITNTVSVDPGNGVCDTGSGKSCLASASLPPVGMIELTKTTSTRSPVLPNSPVMYTLTVYNPGAVPATQITVSDPPPVGISGGTWTCSGSCGAGRGTLPLADTIASLAAGATTVYTIQATTASGNLPAQIINTAQATPAGAQVCLGGRMPPCQASAELNTGLAVSVIPMLNPLHLGLLAFVLGGLSMTGARQRLLSRRG